MKAIQPLVRLLLAFILGLSGLAYGQVTGYVAFVKGTTFYGGKNVYRIGFNNATGGALSNVSASYTLDGAVLTVESVGSFFGGCTGGSVLVNSTTIDISGISMPGDGYCTVDVIVSAGFSTTTVNADMISGTHSLGTLAASTTASFNVERAPNVYLVEDVSDNPAVPTEATLRNYLEALQVEASLFECSNEPFEIRFSIAGPGPHTISPQAALPPIQCATIVTGLTQAGSVANTDTGAGNNADIRIILNGSNCLGCDGLTVNGINSEVRGLSIHSFDLCGIRLTANAAGSRIQGNYIGTDPGGMTGFGNEIGVCVGTGADNVEIGGIQPGDRNLITANVSSGIDSDDSLTAGLAIRNNQIGGGRDGSSLLGNGTGVLSHTGALIENNWVVGNYEGIFVRFDSTVQFNKVHSHDYIGITLYRSNNLAKGNEIYGNGSDGMWIPDAGCTIQDNVVYNNADYGLNIWFGPTTVFSNTVFQNGAGGINVDTGEAVSIVATRSYANNGLSGILFKGLDVANDYSATPPLPPHDADVTGTGGPQNHPDLTAISQSGGNTQIDGVLKTNGLGQSYRIELFSNSAAGKRDGESLEDSFIANTDANGELVFSRILTGLKNNVTATATRLSAPTETSGYSLPVAMPTCGNTEVTSAADTGACTLRSAISYANANCPSGPFTITFNIAGAGPHRIQPVSALPAVTCNTTVIDGYSQPGSSVNSAAPGQTNAVIQIWLDGALASGASGLVFDPSDGWTVKGLSITRFDRGISSRRPGSLRGNFLGVEPDGTTPGKNNYAVFWDIGGAQQFGGVVGGATPADVNLISSNATGVALGNATFVTVQGNLFGFDRSGTPVPGLGWSGNGVASGNCNAGAYDTVVNNFFAYVQSAGSADCGHWEFAGNQVIKGTEVIGSAFGLGIRQRFTRVTYDLTAGNTILDGTYDALDTVSNHKLQFFANPGLPTNVNQEWLQNLVVVQDLTPAAVGAQPFTATVTGLVGNPSLMRTTYSPPRRTERAFQYVRPLAPGALPSPFSVTAGAAPVVQTFTITNALTADTLTLAGLSPVVTGSGFSVGSTTCGATLAPGASCQIGIGYSRGTAGSDTGTFTLELPSTQKNSGGTSVVTALTFALSGTAAAAPAPVFGASTSTLAFGSTALGLFSATQSVTLSNLGTAAMSLSLPPSPVGDFSYTTNCGASLGASASCSVTFTFAPSALGARNGTFSINTDAPGSPHAVSLSGTGVAAGLEPVLSFAPATVVAGNGSTLTVTVTNSSITAATVSTVSVAYPVGLVNAAAPAVATTCAGAVPVAAPGGGSLSSGGAFMVPASSSCTFSASVTALTAGSYSVTVLPGQITSSIGSNTLTSTGTLTVSPPNAPPAVALGFSTANILAGGTTDLLIDITNTNAVAVGGWSLLLNYPVGLVNAPVPNAMALNGLCASNSALTASPGGNSLAWSTTGAGIGPGETCRVQVSLTSGVAGTYSVNVAAGSLVSAVGGNPSAANASLSVGLPPPDASVTPPLLNFGSVSLGTASFSQSVTLTNNSAFTPLGLNALAATGPFSFVAGSTCTVGVPLAPLTNCVINLQFLPLSTGSASGALTLATTAGTLSVSLAGNGTPALVPNLVVVPNPVDFGTVPLGSTPPQQVATLTNTGTGPLDVTGITVPSPFSLEFGPASVALDKPVSAKVVAGLTCPTGAFSLAPNASCTLGINFSASTPGTFNARVELQSTTPSLSFPVTAKAGESKVIKVDPGQIEFGEVVFGQTAPVRTFTVVNAGLQAVTVSDVRIVAAAPSSGATAAEVADFTLMHDCAVLQPASGTGANARCTGTVGFKPTAVGPRSADVRIAGDFAGGVLLLALDGTGTPSPVPLLSFDASRFSFGQAALGVGPRMPMTVRNAGQKPVQLLRIYTSGEFYVQHDCPATLPVGGTCTVSPGAALAVPGQRQGLLIIESDAEGSPAQFPLQASGCRMFTLRDARAGLAVCSAGN